MSKLGGREALAEIDEILRRARDGLSDVERRYNSARSALAKLQHEEIGAWSELAKLRLIAIERGTLLEALDAADHKVAEILRERSAAAAKIDASIDAANLRLGETESQRAGQQDVVAAASDALDAAEGEAQEQLTEDPAYQVQLTTTEDADFVAEQAEDKAESAQRDRLEKGKPYEADPLFNYLWERGYGTSAYAAWPLTRMLDGWVAKLCGYELARRDYRLLTEIPARLREHAERMRADFDAEVENLRALETTAAEQVGVPERAAQLENEEERLASLDADIERQEDALRALVRERVQFANGSDVWYARCIDILKEAMRRKGFALLTERAARTHEPADDRLVAQLRELEGDIRRHEQDLSDYGRVYERERLHLYEVQDVRRRFKRARFDDPRSEFLDAALFTLVLQRLLNGAVSLDDAWKAMRRQQRTRTIRSQPRFGTRRFPRAKRSGPWRWPPGGGGGGGFGGGGFGSGGGFGGGGFRSGGGF
jgi:uncharacterized membrane protein YgcG